MIMKTVRYILGLCGFILLLHSCANSQFVVEKNPQKHNPVDEVAWLKKQKKEFETSPCRITLYEKEGKTYYEIHKPIEGAYDMKTTTLFDESGNHVMSYGGQMPPARRMVIDKFFKEAEKIGIIWECNPKKERVKRKTNNH